MTNIEIPSYIKRMGYEFFCYIFNIDEQEAKKILNGVVEESAKILVLKAFIEYCDERRLKAIDSGAMELNVVLDLQLWFYGEKHIFNFWREQFGGKGCDISTSDPVVESVSKIALAIYPQLLIRFNGDDHGFDRLFFHKTIMHLPENDRLLELIRNDEQLVASLFPSLNPSSITPQTPVKSQFYLFRALPTVLIKNIACLFKFKGGEGEGALLNCVEYTINLLRGESLQVNGSVPFFIGFKNIGFSGEESVDLFSGAIKSYNAGLYDFLSAKHRPDSLDTGFVYENESMHLKDNSLNQAEFDSIVEHIKWTFALSIERTPPVGVRPSWSYCFDPLSFNPGIYGYMWPRSPRPAYQITRSDLDVITEWSKKISVQNCSYIHTAIRRTIMSINEREYSIDAFIDAVISLECLFGANAELSFRISVAVSKLLASSADDRLAMNAKVKKIYDERSKVVHGVKELTQDEAEEKWEQAIDIVLRVFRTLYTQYPELIEDKNRSCTLALL